MKKLLFSLLFIFLCSYAIATVTEGTNAGFVSSAPVADPTGGTSGTHDGYALAAKFTSPSDADTITEVGFWISGSYGLADYEVGLYDNDGSPNNLLYSQTGSSTTASASQWYKYTSLNWDINPSTIYWVATQVDATAGTASIDYETTGGTREYVGSTSLSNHDPWDGGNSSSALLAIYAVYTTTGGERRIMIIQ